MQFRTTIDIKPLERKIDHRSRILSLGSCFATSIAERLQRAKFDITPSPTGILFNPESIAATIDRLDAVSRGDTGALPMAEELDYSNDRWFSYDFHSDFSHPEAEQALGKMRCAVQSGAQALDRADTLIITFGTAFVYRHKRSASVVANCHKQPQSEFIREMLDAEQIAARYKALLQGPLFDKRVIFTISPVRHLGDGLEQNSLSKATLRVAVDSIVKSCHNALYFPSFEIVMDELRDYRFYADDMTHPAAIAVEYIWQRFAKAAFGRDTLTLIETLEQIARAAEHRPFNPEGEQHKKFCQSMLAKIGELQERHTYLNFEKEKSAFDAFL